MTEPSAAALADELERESNRLITSCRVPIELFDRVRAALRAKSPASPGDGRAVAWRYRSVGRVGGIPPWCFSGIPVHGNLYEVEPLFAAPPQAKQPTEARTERGEFSGIVERLRNRAGVRSDGTALQGP